MFPEIARTLHTSISRVICRLLSLFCNVHPQSLSTVIISIISFLNIILHYFFGLYVTCISYVIMDSQRRWPCWLFWQPAISTFACGNKVLFCSVLFWTKLTCVVPFGFPYSYIYVFKFLVALVVKHFTKFSWFDLMDQNSAGWLTGRLISPKLVCNKLPAWPTTVYNLSDRWKEIFCLRDSGCAAYWILTFNCH